MTEPDATYGYLLRLLSIGLYSAGEQTYSPDAGLTPGQWRRVLDEAVKQTVAGVAFTALSRLPESGMPPEEILATWLAMAHGNARKYSEMSAVLSRLTELFAASGLHPVLQKGHAAARFYPVPELRACGDIDLWFPGGERSRADSLAGQLGAKVIATPDNGSCYVTGSTEVEHHSMLVEIHNPFHSRLTASICRDYPPCDVVVDKDIIVSVPSPMVELLMMNAHILKHCLGVGIGLRQFCDYALAWRRFADCCSGQVPTVDANEYFNLCRRLGIISWTRTLHRFINRYLPLPDGGDAVTEVAGRVDDKTVRRLFNLVAEGGNFGRYNPRRRSGAGKTTLQRKLHTMSAFVNNRSFVFRLAPSEAFWTFTRLIVGQIH